MKNAASSANNQTFQQLMNELAAVVDRIMDEEKARRQALAREIRAQLEALDGEVADIEVAKASVVQRSTARRLPHRPVLNTKRSVGAEGRI